MWQQCKCEAERGVLIHKLADALANEGCKNQKSRARSNPVVCRPRKVRTFFDEAGVRKDREEQDG